MRLIGILVAALAVFVLVTPNANAAAPTGKRFAAQHKAWYNKHYKTVTMNKVVCLNSKVQQTTAGKKRLWPCAVKVTVKKTKAVSCFISYVDAKHQLYNLTLVDCISLKPIDASGDVR